MTCTHLTCGFTATPSASPLRRFPWYRRLHAWALAQGNARYENAIHSAKQGLLGGLTGEVLEIGPGSGANLAYLSRAARWTGVEPNIFSHAYLQAEAARRGIDALIVDGVAESLPVADASVDAVVSSLVLCSVGNPAAALAEIRRVLKPGGRFVFIEHVAARKGTWLRRIQRIMRGPQAVLGDGCAPDRDTLEAIEAAGFTWVVACEDHMPVPLVGPHVLGFAIR